MTLWLRGLAILLLICGLGLHARAQSREPRVALVVGNAAYKHGAALRNPVRDADAMALALQELGFAVIKAVNADRGRMGRALSEFRARMQADGIGLFFYAGHGLQVHGVNYLIPVDADIQEELDASYAGVDVQQVLRAMENAGSRFNMVLLDACRDNPFERAFRGAGSRGLAPIDAPRGTLIAFATAPGRTAADGEGGNGLFTSELLRAMSEPGLSVDEVLKRAGAGVEKASGNRQVPWVTSSFRGAFYFRPPATAAPQASPPPAASSPPGASDREVVFWTSVKDSSDPAELDAYLAQYPNGVFAALARARLERLKPRPQQQAAVVPPVPPPGPAIQDISGTHVAIRQAKVRAAPAANGKELGALVGDDTVTVTGRVKDQDWLRIAWRGGIGYVSAALLREIDPAEAQAWSKVKDTRRAEELQAFLQAHPNGHYGKRAAAQLAALRAPPKPQSPAPATIPAPAPAPAMAPVPPAPIFRADEPIPLGCPAAGTTLRITSGRLTFSGANGIYCNYTNPQGEPASREWMFATYGSEFANKHAKDLARLWPLAEGKKIELLYGTGGTTWKYVYEVVRRERVTVPAGSFDTMLIKQTQTGLGGNTFRGERSFWYAPEVGYFVKYEPRVISGYMTSPDERWELLQMVRP